MQALWKLALEPIAETLADPNSYGFQPERATAVAIEQCFIALAKRASPEWILEGNIRGCFDNFSHAWLLANIPMDKKMLRRWLQAGYIDEGTLFATRAGSPQGGPLTPWTQKITSSLSGRLRCAVRSRYLTCAVRSNMFASYGPIYPVRKGSALERCIRSDRPRVQPQRGRRGVDRAVRFIVASSIPILAGGAETQASGNGLRADYSHNDQGSWRRRGRASGVRAEEWSDDRRDGGACGLSFPREGASAWLIAAGDAMTYPWNIPLTDCWQRNWRRSTTSWCRIAPAVPAWLLR